MIEKIEKVEKAGEEVSRKTRGDRKGKQSERTTPSRKKRVPPLLRKEGSFKRETPPSRKKRKAQQNAESLETWKLETFVGIKLAVSSYHTPHL